MVKFYPNKSSHEDMKRDKNDKLLKDAYDVL